MSIVLDRPAGASRAPRQRPARLRVGPGGIVCTAAFVAVAFFVLYPLWLLLIHSFEVGDFGTATHLGLDNWSNAFTQREVATSIWNTVLLAITRQGLALILGIPVAWLIARTDLPGRRVLEFGFWIAVFLPSLTVLVGWIMLFDGYSGIVNKVLQPLLGLTAGPFEIYSWWGIIFVHLMGATLGVKVMFLAPAFRNMDAALEDASRASGAGTLGTLLRISAPLLAPAIVVATLLGVIASLEAFEVEMVLGRPERIDVFSTMIYRLSRQQPPEYGSATALSMLILLIMVPVILCQQWMLHGRQFTTVTGKYSVRIHRLRGWKWPLFALVTGLVTLMTVVPTALVIIASFMRGFGAFTIKDAWTLQNWTDALGNRAFLSSLSNTVVLASGTAVLSVVAFALLAYISVRTRYRARGGLDFLTWIPSLLPGMMISLAMLWLFLETPIFKPLYGSMFVLVLAVSLGGMSRSVQMVKASLLQLGAELEEASRTSGANWWPTFRRVTVPLVAPTLVIVGILGFSSASRTASHVALLASASGRPLSLLQLDFLADGRFETASVLGVVILLLTIGAAILAYAFGFRSDAD